MNANWHPNCFKCELCSDILTDKGFFKHTGRALCQGCNDKEKLAAVGKYFCFKCKAIIDEGSPLKHKVSLIELGLTDALIIDSWETGGGLPSVSFQLQNLWRGIDVECTRSEGRAVLFAVSRQNGHSHLRCLPTTHRGASGHCTG